ncbi:MAG: hypothetical protein K2I24_07240 [Duncaniella sp.]|nr:hypothetical protein [Duncaniella sp.]
MKKIATLILAAFMAAPVVSAEDIKMSVYKLDGKFEEGFKLGAFVGNITSDVKYDEASKVYTITNFLGYDKANVEFRVMTDETLELNGEKRYGIEYLAENTPAEGSIVKTNGSFKIDFVLIAENPDKPDNPMDNAFRSGVVTGAEETYQFVNPAVWGITGYTSDAAIPNMIRRTYALKQGEGYKFFFEFDSVAQWIDGGEGYEYVDYPAPKNMLVFSYPDNGDDQTAITDIDADNDAPAEYYNLQGVRVDNPTAGIYICRKGDKTSKVVIR